MSVNQRSMSQPRPLGALCALLLGEDPKISRSGLQGLQEAQSHLSCW